MEKSEEGMNGDNMVQLSPTAYNNRVLHNIHRVIHTTVLTCLR